MITPELLTYIKTEREKGTDEDMIKNNLLKSGWTNDDYNQTLNQNTTQLPLSNRKSNKFIKIYIALGVFIFIGFIVFIIKIMLSNSGNMLIENSPWNNTINIFLEIWGIVFAYILPLGIIYFGFWSIFYKESGIEKPAPIRHYQEITSIANYIANGRNTYKPVIKLQGNRAVVAGIFYLLLGLFIAWGVTGILLGIICKSPVCASFPKSIKFF